MLFCLLWPEEHSHGLAHTIKIKIKILCTCSFLHRPRDNGFSHHFQRSHDRVSAVWKFACNKHSAIRIRIPPLVLFGAILRLLGVVETSYMGSSQVFPPRHKLTPVRHNVTIKTSNKGSGEQFGKSSEITLIRLWKQKDLHKRKDQNVGHWTVSYSFRQFITQGLETTRCSVKKAKLINTAKTRVKPYLSLRNYWEKLTCSSN